MKASSFTSSFLQALAVVPAFIFTSTGFAQPATFKEGILQIPQTAELIKGEAHYYNDIQLALDTNGNFTVREAEPSPLVFVDSVTVIMTKSLPPQVSIVVRGNKSVPCVELQNPAIFRDGFSFTVALAETKIGPAETCIAIIEPFETHIRLDTVGLESGIYTVDVNGKEEGFSL